MSSETNKTDAFDPFNINEDFDQVQIRSSRNKTNSHVRHSSQRQSASSGGSVASITSSASSVLPPKIIVRLSIHEEVSTSIESNEKECRASIEGIIKAQVHSSNATKNSPFILQFSDPPGSDTDFRFNNDFVSRIPTYESAGDPSEQKGTNTQARLMIPKAEIGTVNIAKYTTHCEIKHMPFLAQSKVKFDDNICRIALQVRSNLANKGDLEDFTIAVAFPPQVKAVKVTKGDGKWDSLKRTIKWSLDCLPKGKSMMISAEAELVASVNDDDAPDVLPHFPILLRCHSKTDRVGKLKIQAGAVDGHPATFTIKSANSFRLLHRVS